MSRRYGVPPPPNLDILSKLEQINLRVFDKMEQYIELVKFRGHAS